MSESTFDPTAVSFVGQGLKLDTQDDAYIITQAIDEREKLVKINLEGNTLGIEASAAIGRALRSKPDLKFALLKDLFTGRLKTEIPEALQHLTEGIAASGAQLVELDLSDNAFGPIGMKALVDFLGSESCRNLQFLRLNNNGLGIQGATLLASVIGQLGRLEVFICGRNRLENDGSSVVARSLKNISTLKTIEMPQNGIRAEGIRLISDVILSNRELTQLNLNDNTMAEEGGEAIASSLEVLTDVKIINFGDCLIRSGGCVAILKALSKSGSLKTMEKLLLNGNEISGDEAVETILEIFAQEVNPALEIDLSNNNFGDDNVNRLWEQTGGRVSLILDDDEGLPDEGEEKEEEDEDGDLSSFINSADVSLDDLCSKFVDISINSFDELQQSLPKKALKQTEELISAGIKKESDPYLLANSLLVQLGLLKSEDRKLKKVTDLRGPFMALANSTKQLNKEQRDVLQLFIGNRPSKFSDQTGQFKHRLLQALFC